MTKFPNEFYPIIFWILFIFIIMIIIYFTIHPIIITLLLVIYTTIISINISLWKPNYLYSIILFLIIIRGLIIIFIYFSRLISNEKIIYINKILFIIIIYLIIIFILFIKFIHNYIIKFRSIDIYPSIKLNYKLFNRILNLYEYPHVNITLLRIIFLILCFLLIIKLCNFKSYSIRKLNYD